MLDRAKVRVCSVVNTEVAGSPPRALLTHKEISDLRIRQWLHALDGRSPVAGSASIQLDSRPTRLIYRMIRSAFCFERCPLSDRLSGPLFG
jgi:hypothetical protein